MCMLHGVTMLQVDAMPTCGFAKSSSLKPDGAQHGAARRLREPIDDDARVAARVDAWGVLVLLCHGRGTVRPFDGDAIMAVSITARQPPAVRGGDAYGRKPVESAPLAPLCHVSAQEYDPAAYP